jgi:hypothetical protein
MGCVVIPKLGDDARLLPSLRGAFAPKQARAASTLPPLWIATPQAQFADFDEAAKLQLACA